MVTHDNVLIGNNGSNILTGNAGNDILDGAGGADTMVGGTGSDTYVVDNTVDIADETGGDGTDTVNASVTFCLADTVHAKGSIENLTLTGTGAINATTGDEKKNAAIDYMIEKLAYVEESKLCGSNTEYMIAL